MRFVLLNTHQLSEAWLYPYLNDDLHADTKVCIFILEELSAYEEEKEMVEQQFKKGSRNYDALVTPLLTYGIKEDNIIFSYAHDQDATGKIRGADVLFIYGRKDAYIYLGDELKEEILQFDGLIIGIQLGALIQMDEYYRIEEEEAGFEEGLGLLSGFSLVIDYEQTINQIKG
ncbi:MAG: hypothetical protein IJ875_00760, partial [Solobacterium sp.]|nr:hypothetical protein [Solobacterium sp.]